MMKRTFCLLLAIPLLAVLSCSDMKSGDGKKQAGNQGAAKQYLAKIDGNAISLQQVQEEYDMLPPDVQEVFSAPGGMRQLLDELVKKEILYLEAQKQGLQNKDDFKNRLENYKKRLMVELLLNEKIKDAAVVSDKEIKDFFEKNRESFITTVPGQSKPKVMKFEEVEDIIRRYLLSEKQKELFDSYIASLKGGYKVDLNEDMVNTAFGNAPAMQEVQPPAK